MTTAQSLQLRAGECWARGDLYGADDALRALIETQGGDTPQTDLMTLRLSLDLLEFDRAKAALDRLRRAGAADPGTAMAGARLLTWQGERDAALQLLDEALVHSPGHAGLVALQVTHARDLSAARLQTAEKMAQALPDEAAEKTGLLFPLARHYDRAGDYTRSWTLMLEANRLSAARMGPPIAPEGLKAALIARARKALKAAETLPHAARHDQRHVYLIGAPRTGSSLLQSILSAHDGVDSSGERGALLPFLHEITDRHAAPPAGHLARLQAADLSGLDRAGRTAPVLIDKTTHNAYLAPLIAAIHPDSIFINVTRRAHDVALSMLFHEFPPAFPEATTLDGIIAMLEARAEIMALYDAAGFRVQGFDFDQFAAAPEPQGRTLADLAGIPFDPRTLSPAQRNAAVPTFSAGQVRQPIKPTAPDRWQRFADCIPAPLKQRLDALNMPL